MRYLFIICLLTIIIFACKREVITKTNAIYNYINNSGYVMKIESFKKGVKTNYSLKEKDTMEQKITLVPASDTSGLISSADSVKLIFKDSISVVIKRTDSLSIINIMNKNLYVKSVSRDGLTDYFRYTVTKKEVDSAK